MGRSSSVVSNYFVTAWTTAHQAPLSMGFSRQEYCSGLPFPSPGDLPDPGIEPTSPVSPALESGFFTPELPGKPIWEGSTLKSEKKSCTQILIRLIKLDFQYWFIQ